MIESVQVTDWGEEIEYCCTIYDSNRKILVKGKRMADWQWLESENARKVYFQKKDMF